MFCLVYKSLYVSRCSVFVYFKCDIIQHLCIQLIERSIETACDHFFLAKNEIKYVVHKPGPLATIFISSMPISVLATSVSVTFLLSVCHPSDPEKFTQKSQCKGTKLNHNNKSITLFDLSTDLERFRSRERCRLRDGEDLRSRSRDRLRFLSLSLVPEDSASFLSEESAAIYKKRTKHCECTHMHRIYQHLARCNYTLHTI